MQQLELGLLFHNNEAIQGLSEFSSRSLVHAMIAACQDENKNTILGDTLQPETARPVPDPSCYQQMLQGVRNLKDNYGANSNSFINQDSDIMRDYLKKYVFHDLSRRVSSQLQAFGAVLYASAETCSHELSEELLAESCDAVNAGCSGLLEKVYFSFFIDQNNIYTIDFDQWR